LNFSDDAIAIGVLIGLAGGIQSAPIAINPSFSLLLITGIGQPKSATLAAYAK
jgi:hypothetical protein